ncbi:hypothetical protein GALL_42450 [mine drainage metagenome]|uniref:Methyltransferase domain-containing protein n=1 Tax=mine drainage metagenome TaxID=410659 RepID=A0A1J5TSX0_9ZZZZ
MTSRLKSRYESLWARIKGAPNAHEQAVGGEFEAWGKLEFSLLRHIAGLQRHHSVVDVGCGSGRLALPLSGWLEGPYLGTDILPDLLLHAEKICQRPEWRFVATEGLEIPAVDRSADLVCFFSVFTHLTHEDSYRYVLEAARVLRAGGRLVCSFLEFRLRSHWAVFRDDLADRASEKILNQFMGRDVLEAFAHNAGLRVERFLDGDQANIPLDEEIVFQSGHRAVGAAPFGQSVCVLEKTS